MDTCSPEIHTYVFSFACTDSGATGRSLSLVSRYVRQVSASFKWYSPSISGKRQARQFVDVLHKTAIQPRISHLFLSTRCSCQTADAWWEEPEVCQQWSELQDTILHFAALTLITLTFASFDSPYFGAECIYRLLKVPFHILTELSIRVHSMPNRIKSILDDAYGLYGRKSPSGVLQTTARTTIRRLHIACLFSEECDTEGIRDIVQIIAPNLTHLRLSALEQVTCSWRIPRCEMYAPRLPQRPFRRSPAFLPFPELFWQYMATDRP
ncbi:hypothetical protein SCP_0101550 [Sparassis crispa]|uniref:F-box domain-containing protein n=1 Tax=Sparassis crispa TaxID=139825 RepID=A0A401G541_9APHY|nr:hypothetical protein SCP_0101550 [Sparassis crispa]GBE77282.1 hypothetical protein SCP_0101550 [Sparassis crispa]